MAKKKDEPKTQEAELIQEPEHQGELVVRPTKTEEERKDESDLMAKLEQEVPALLMQSQVAILTGCTPKHVIKWREGRAGQMYPYAPVDWFVDTLNKGFRFNWDWIPETDTDNPEWLALMLKLKQFIVSGTLVVRNKDGKEIRKYGTGRAEIKFKKGDKDNPSAEREPLDLGNDLKAAWSDALKKAASLLGIALDLYSGSVARREDKDHPDGQITEDQRRRLEVLAADAGLGHSGLKKLIAKMFDYTSTTEIKRRHFAPISEQLQLIANEKELKNIAVPEKITQGFDLLGLDENRRKVKVMQFFTKYGADDWVEKLHAAISSELDKRQQQDASKTANSSKAKV